MFTISNADASVLNSDVAGCNARSQPHAVASSSDSSSSSSATTKSSASSSSSSSATTSSSSAVRIRTTGYFGLCGGDAYR